MSIEQGIVLGLYGIDVLMTYLSASLTLKIKPHLKYKDMELNKIVVFMWNKFGLKRGTIYANLIIAPIVVLLVLLLPLKYVSMMLGAWLIITFMHYENWRYLKFDYAKVVGSEK